MLGVLPPKYCSAYISLYWYHLNQVTIMSPWLSCSPFYLLVIHSPHSSQRGLSKTEESFTMLSWSCHSPPKTLSWSLSRRGTKGWAPHHVIKAPTWPAVPHILNLPFYQSSSRLLCSSHSRLSLPSILISGLLCSFSLPETTPIMSIFSHSVLSSFHSHLSPQSSPWLCPSCPSGICAMITSSKKPPEPSI